MNDDVAFKTIGQLVQQMSHWRITQSSANMGIRRVKGTGMIGGGGTEGKRVRNKKILRTTDIVFMGMQDF